MKPAENSNLDTGLAVASLALLIWLVLLVVLFLGLVLSFQTGNYPG